MARKIGLRRLGDSKAGKANTAKYAPKPKVEAPKIKPVVAVKEPRSL